MLTHLESIKNQFSCITKRIFSPYSKKYNIFQFFAFWGSTCWPACLLPEKLAADSASQGRSQGGGRGAPPRGFQAPRAAAGRRPARAKTPAEATETITEVTKSVRKPTKKHIRAVGPLWPSEPARKKNRAPVSIRGPSDSQSHHRWSFWISGTLQTVRGHHQGTFWTSGTLWSSGPLWLTGHL